jgi:hypothetical protein
MAGDTGTDDCLENRLRDATAEDSEHLLEEFLTAFCQSEAAVVNKRHSWLSNSASEEVTFQGHLTE